MLCGKNTCPIRDGYWNSVRSIMLLFCAWRPSWRSRWRSNWFLIDRERLLRGEISTSMIWRSFIIWLLRRDIRIIISMVIRIILRRLMSKMVSLSAAAKIIPSKCGISTRKKRGHSRGGTKTWSARSWSGMSFRRSQPASIERSDGLIDVIGEMRTTTSTKTLKLQMATNIQSTSWATKRMWHNLNDWITATTGLLVLPKMEQLRSGTCMLTCIVMGIQTQRLLDTSSTTTLR